MSSKSTDGFQNLVAFRAFVAQLGPRIRFLGSFCSHIVIRCGPIWLRDSVVLQQPIQIQIAIDPCNEIFAKFWLYVAPSHVDSSVCGVATEPDAGCRYETCRCQSNPQPPQLKSVPSDGCTVWVRWQWQGREQVCRAAAGEARRGTAVKHCLTAAANLWVHGYDDLEVYMEYGYVFVSSTGRNHVRMAAFSFNLLAPGRSGFTLKSAIFNLVLLIGIFTSPYDNAFRWMSWDLSEDKSTLVQVMAWCHQATSHYLSQCWPRPPSPYGVTRAQWVNRPNPGPMNHCFTTRFTVNCGSKSKSAPE